MKRMLAAALCITAILAAFAGCGEKKESLREQDGFIEVTPEEDKSIADEIERMVDGFEVGADTNKEP
jgi:hypothetical protein